MTSRSSTSPSSTSTAIWRSRSSFARWPQSCCCRWHTCEIGREMARDAAAEGRSSNTQGERGVVYWAARTHYDGDRGADVRNRADSVSQPAQADVVDVWGAFCEHLGAPAGPHTSQTRVDARIEDVG